MPTSAPSPDPKRDASAAVHAAARAYWDARLEADPVEATLLGDHRWDDRLPDLSPAANEAAKHRLSSLLAQTDPIDRGALSDDDRVTLSALRNEIQSERAQRECWLGEWAVDPRDGPQVAYMSLATLQPVVTPADGDHLIARWRKLPQELAARVENLRRAKASGKVAAREGVERVIRQLDDLLAHPADAWALSAPARREYPDWPNGARTRFAHELSRVVQDEVIPAFAAYRDVLVREIRPAARGDQAAGLSHIEGGAACYAHLIRVHTSLDLSAAEIHRIGLAEVARVRGEMTALGEALFHTRDLHAIQQRLRGDPNLYFHNRDEVEAKAREALARAEAALPHWLGTLPKTPCVVKRVEAFEEKDTTIAYYRQPAIDGSRPGTYMINTYAPETRPRYEAEALAFHESVPGHHTQIALAQERANVPEFRRHLGPTAYVEGWALYTERLANEMGIYSGDLDRMGMLSFDAWRACRLVVDTGLHAMGWTRQQAIAYMLENTALAENNIINEVDRYIGWPGQALAYKLGQLEILRLRAEAQQQLGGRFTISAFHDEVLRHGAIALTTLREEIALWVKRTAAQ